MKVLNSKIFDLINSCLFFIQSKFDKVRQNSFILLNIDWFILMAVFAVYISSIFAVNNITAIFAFIVPLLVVLKVLITKGEKIELETCNFYLLAYLFICLISNFTSSMPVQSFYGFYKTLLYFAFYFAMCQFLKNNKGFVAILMLMIAFLVTGESIIGIMQNAAGVANIATWQDTSYVNPEDVLTRVYGTLKPYNPNLFGGWLIAGISSVIGLCALYISDKKIFPFLIALCSFLMSVLCLFYTGCRGAYIALLVIIISLLLVLMRINKRCKTAAALIAVSGSTFVLLHHGIFQRLMSIFIMRSDSSTSFRMNVYNSALQMFHDNPVWGIGVGNKVFREIYGLYMLSGFDALSCYCVFLEIAVESGIFALLAFLMFLGSLLNSGFRKFVSSDNRAEKIVLFTAFTSVLAVMVHGFVDTIFFRPQIQFVFWTMASILTVLSKEETNGN